MKIIICSDHGAGDLKEEVKRVLKEQFAEAEEVREKILIRDKIAIKEFGDLAFMSGIGGIICVLYDDLDEIIW